MLPTILIGDHVFVSKFAYRLNLPFSEYFGEPVKLIDRGIPKRGEIIVFESPRNREINYIKRVIGLPGDVIRIRDRQLFINENVVSTTEPTAEETQRVLKLLKDPKLDGGEIHVLKETTDSIDHWLLQDRNNFISENFGPYQVPEGKVFVMGDNRDFSDDSRFIGPIALNKIRGRASWIWLSIWLNFKPYEFEFRPWRTGKALSSL